MPSEDNTRWQKGWGREMKAGNRRMTKFASGLLLFTVLAMGPQLAACAGGAQILPVKEADFAVRDQQPFWLDNAHVLFRGYTGSEGVLGKDFRYLNEGWYVWDIERGTVAKDTRFEGAGPECINGHTKSYVLRYPTDGETPKRQAFVDGKKITLPDRTWLNPISCRLSSTEPSWVVKGRATRPLLEEHGYLDRGEFGEDNRSKEPILYYRVGTTEPISLGLEARRVEPLVTYYPFADAYLLKGVPTDAYAPPPSGCCPQTVVSRNFFHPKAKLGLNRQWLVARNDSHGDHFILRSEPSLLSRPACRKLMGAKKQGATFWTVILPDEWCKARRVGAPSLQTGAKSSSEGGRPMLQKKSASNCK